MSELRIVAAGAERIADLEPLWRSLLEHHLKVDEPDLAAIRRERQTWAGRRRGFEQLLAHPDSFVLIAEIDGTPVGYCVVDVRGREDNWRIAGDRYADLESIAVLPLARGHGVGTALMKEVYRRPAGARCRRAHDAGRHRESGSAPLLRSDGLSPVDGELSGAHSRLRGPTRARRPHERRVQYRK